MSLQICEPPFLMPGPRRNLSKLQLPLKRVNPGLVPGNKQFRGHCGPTTAATTWQKLEEGTCPQIPKTYYNRLKKKGYLY